MYPSASLKIEKCPGTPKVHCSTLVTFDAAFGNQTVHAEDNIICISS
jgi:hypothetical protein